MIKEGPGGPPPLAKAELSRALSEPLLLVRELPEPLRRRKFLPQLLVRLEHAGRLRRVRRGAYLVVPPGVAPAAFHIDPYALTGLLGPHRAISFHSALAFRGLAESAGSRITLQSPTPFAPFTFEGISYAPVVTRHLFGFETAYRDGVRIQVTDVERTLLDGLRNPASMGGLDEFLRSLEGVRRSDLLALILDSLLDTSKLPSWTRFRATYDDRRDELNQLLEQGLVRKIGPDHFTLGLSGLSFCPHPAAAAELEHVRNVHAFLRTRYKQTPGGTLSCARAAAALKMDPSAFARAALHLAVPLAGVAAPPGPEGRLPKSVTVSEPLLDCVDADELLDRLRRELKPPPAVNRRPAAVVSVRFEKLLEHLERFDETSLYSKTGFLLRLFESRWKPAPEVFLALRKKVGLRKTLFPPGLPTGAGRYLREWNLIVPLHLHSRTVAAAGRGPDAPL